MRYEVTFKWSNGAALTMIQNASQSDEDEYFSHLETGTFDANDPAVCGWVESYAQADLSALMMLEAIYPDAQLLIVEVSKRELTAP